MRRAPLTFLLAAVVLVVAACGSPAASNGEPGQSTGGEASEGAAPSEGAQASQGGGGGGGGGGANGSITYQITGGYEASGEVPFQPGGGAAGWTESEGGWIANFVQSSGEGAYIVLNTFTRGQILTYSDGQYLVAVGSDESTGYDCTFNVTKNDASGTAGDMSCNDVPASSVDTGQLVTVDFSAQWDAHP
jgi:hypothetical protein